MRIHVYERQGALSPLQAPQSPVLLPEGDFGANAAGAVGKLAAGFQKLQDDADDARTLELFSKFKADSNDYHDNPDTGLYNTRLGYSARGVYSDADTWLRKRGEDYANTLKSNRAKANFRKMASDYIIQQGQANSRFEAQQIRKYQTEQADAAIKNGITDIGNNWSNPQAIERARDSIRQALELKTRGQGFDVYRHELADIEDKIATARISQAYAQDPMLAARLLDDKDFHFLPDTYSRLRQIFSKNSEVYELQAIAENFASRFSPETSEQAYHELVRLYGADKGNKAYTSLTHIWQVQHTQKSALKQQDYENQQELVRSITLRFLDPNSEKPSEAEIRGYIQSKKLDPSTGSTFINAIKANEAANARQLDKDRELHRKKYEMEIDLASWRGNWAEDSMLDTLTRRGDISQSFADSYRVKRKQFLDEKARDEKNARKKSLKDNSDKYIAQLADPERNGSVDPQKVRDDMNNGKLEPERARAILNAIDEINKANDAKIKADTKSAIAHNEAALRYLAETGHVFSREEIRQKQDNQEISADFARYLYDKANAHDKQQQTLRKQSEEDNRKANIYKQAQSIAEMFSESDSGNGRKFIQSLNINEDDRNLLLADYEAIIKTQKTIQSDKDKISQDNDKISKDSKEQLYKIIWRQAFFDGIHLSDEQLSEYVANDTLNQAQAKELQGIRIERENAAAKAREDVAKDNALQRAKSLADTYGLDNLQKAYDEIRSIPDRKEQLLVQDYFNSYVSQLRSIRSEDDRQKAEAQRREYNNLNNTYWRNFKPVPAEIIKQHEQNGTLSPEQIFRAWSLNEAISTRDGIIARLRQDESVGYDSLSRTEQEKAVMLLMGTDNESRIKNVSELLALLADGKLTDARIDWDFAHGRISADDRENLKDYDKKFSQEQKRLINQAAKDLVLSIQKVGIKKNSALYQNMALTDFYRMASTLDIHSKDFTKTLADMVREAQSAALDAYGDTIVKESGLFWTAPTPAEQRRQNSLRWGENYSVQPVQPAINYQAWDESFHTINPQTASADFSAIPEQPQEIPPQPETPPTPTVQQPQPLNIYQPPRDRAQISPPPQQPAAQSLGIVDFTKGVLQNVAYHITDGYYAAKKAYRQGRSHFAIDLRAPIGSAVSLAGNGLSWIISRVGNSKAVGNFITAATTTHNGDNLEITYGHLSSVDVKQGDTLTSGDVVAKSGNTGNVTGPHLHISAKLNGKPVDPRSIDFGSPVSNDIHPAVVPVISQDVPPPVVSSDAQRQDWLFGLFLDGKLSADNNIWATSFDYEIPILGGY